MLASAIMRDVREKVCSQCGSKKSTAEFTCKTKVADGKKYPSSECKRCAAGRVKRRYCVLRAQVFEVLGDSCVRCGFDDKRALQFDHINNNGYEERRKYRGYGMYRHILKVKGRGYQILCANCNWIKKLEA